MNKVSCGLYKLKGKASRVVGRGSAPAGSSPRAPAASPAAASPRTSTFWRFGWLLLPSIFARAEWWRLRSFVAMDLRLTLYLRFLLKNSSWSFPLVAASFASLLLWLSPFCSRFLEVQLLLFECLNWMLEYFIFQWLISRLAFISIVFELLNARISRSTSISGTMAGPIFELNTRIGAENKQQNGLRFLAANRYV